MNAMLQEFHNTLIQGLRRSSIQKTSKWAEMYRIMGQPFPGNYSFVHHPWTREMHDCDAEIMIGQKAAQLGFTEVALNKTFKAIDIDGKSVLYILPAATPDAGDFSKSRFDPALEMSPHLSKIFTSVQNIGHKRAGNANLFIRGSHSRSQLKSVPAALLVFDEVDEMSQENISLGLERSSGQFDKQAVFISTPTISDFGINTLFKASSQKHFMFQCPHCSRHTELIFPDCLTIIGEDYSDIAVLNSHLKCKECKVKLDHETKSTWLADAHWVASYTNRISVGYYINQLYSMTLHPSDIAISYLKGLTNPDDAQQLYNSKLGDVYTAPGAQIKDSDIDSCTKDYISFETYPKNAICTLGVDVGTQLHYSIEQWFLKTSATATSDINLLATPKLLKFGTLEHFEDLDVLMKDFHILYAVVDVNPETRKATEFAQRFFGRVSLCEYSMGVNHRQLVEKDDCVIAVDRTSWLDLALSRFKNQTIALPQNTDLEYRNHIKALIRVTKLDKNGNPVARYIKSEKLADHFAHTRVYSEIAFPLAVKLAENKSITERVI